MHSSGVESWAYNWLDGSSYVFHFEEDWNHGHRYHLMNRLRCDSDWLDDAVMIDPQLGLLSAHCDRMNVLSTSADHRQHAFEALATDSDRPAFLRELPFFFDLYTFRGEEGRTSVVAAVAVPRDKLNLSEVASNPAYRIDLSLILVDTLSRRVVRQDDSVTLATQHANKNDDLFRLHVEINALPSKTTVQRVIVSDPSEPGIGQLYGGPFLIPDYSGTRLMLSDIVLAEPGVKGFWHRGKVALALVPTRYYRGGSFNVFYEIYNIPKDATYTTEIEIASIRSKLKGLFGGGMAPIRLKFDGVASDVEKGALQELRRVDTRLKPGSYRLRITVKNAATGETARNERTFSVPK
jgi:hypothetical protein